MSSESTSESTTHITFGLVIGWVFAVIVGVPGIMSLFEPGGFAAGLFLILAALVALPPANAYLKTKAHVSLSGTLRVVIIIVLCIMSGALMPRASAEKGVSVPATPDTPAPAEQGAAPTSTSQVSPPQPTAPQVLLDIKGSGTKSTQKFTAGSDWDLNWSYDCSNFGYQGNFQVTVFNGDGTESFNNAPVNQLGKSGSDVEHYHAGGTYYLEVNSECNWHIQAKG